MRCRKSSLWAGVASHGDRAIGPSELAVAPAHEALARAGLAVGDIDLVAFATMTPDVTFPGAACFFQHKLSAGTTAAVDLRGQCAGFITGLMVADAYLSTGVYRHVLLAAVEVTAGSTPRRPGSASRRTATARRRGARCGRRRRLRAVVCQ
jgi:3-oxoacyl-[acyl-carrier-protein] synthase III